MGRRFQDSGTRAEPGSAPGEQTGDTGRPSFTWGRAGKAYDPQGPSSFKILTLYLSLGPQIPKKSAHQIEFKKKHNRGCVSPAADGPESICPSAGLKSTPPDTWSLGSSLPGSRPCVTQVGEAGPGVPALCHPGAKALNPGPLVSRLAKWENPKSSDSWKRAARPCSTAVPGLTLSLVAGAEPVRSEQSQHDLTLPSVCDECRGQFLDSVNDKLNVFSPRRQQFLLPAKNAFSFFKI